MFYKIDSKGIIISMSDFDILSDKEISEGTKLVAKIDYPLRNVLFNTPKFDFKKMSWVEGSRKKRTKRDKEKTLTEYRKFISSSYKESCREFTFRKFPVHSQLEVLYDAVFGDNKDSKLLDDIKATKDFIATKVTEILELSEEDIFEQIDNGNPIINDLVQETREFLEKLS